MQFMSLSDFKELLNSLNAIQIIKAFNAYILNNRYTDQQIKICGAVCRAPAELLDGLTSDKKSVYKTQDLASILKSFFVETYEMDIFEIQQDLIYTVKNSI